MADPCNLQEGSIMHVGALDPVRAAEMIGSLGADTRVIVVTVDDPAGWDRQEATGSLSRALRSSEIPSILSFLAHKGKVVRELVDSFDICYMVHGSSVVTEAESVSAEEAAQAGLVNLAEEKAFILSKSLETAERIASLAPIAVRYARKAVSEGTKVDLESGLAIESALFSELFGTQDMREGTKAFIEKRPPSFRGS